ncbi:unnamed protein product [Urochloa decumbens]|uniref:Uncharacterized protein n=1 Tax=Urochloa decumbens TaxID=240449 RepID=A0ABC9CV78_9POAL
MAGGNHFALLESNDPGDTRLADINKKPQPAASLTQELFGGAYPSAWKVRPPPMSTIGGGLIRKREKQQSGASGLASAKDDGAPRAKNAQQGGAKKKGGRHANGAAAGDEAPAPRLYDLAQFPSLK